MDRNRMLFCPDLATGLTTQDISDELAAKVFGDKDFAKLLKARYDQMGELFRDAHYDDPRWDLKEPFSDCKNKADRDKKDARLVVPRSRLVSAPQNVTSLFDHDNFGHDMPVWVTYNNDPKAKRVMIVSQDPLRGSKDANDEKGNLYLSSPFGVHSCDFESGGMDPRVRDMVNSFLRADLCVYLTDYMKFFAKEKGFIKKMVMRKKDPLGYRKKFSDALEYEIKNMVKPSLIIFLSPDFVKSNYTNLPINQQTQRDKIAEIKWLNSKYKAIITRHPNARFVKTEDNPHPAKTYFNNIVEMVLKYLSYSVV